MKKLLLPALMLAFIGCKDKQPDVEYIISGNDTIAFTAYNGYSVDLSKSKNAHSYRNKTKDSSFTVFENSISGLVDSIQFKDSVICFFYTIRKTK